MGAEGVRMVIVLSLRQKDREAEALMKTLTPDLRISESFFIKIFRDKIQITRKCGFNELQI